MTPSEFYKQLAITTEPITITLAPGPLTMIGSPQDALSAELMLWIIDRMSDATQGDVEEVLVNALCWSRFWAAVIYADTHEQPEQQVLL